MIQVKVKIPQWGFVKGEILDGEIQGKTLTGLELFVPYDDQEVQLLLLRSRSANAVWKNTVLLITLIGVT